MQILLVASGMHIDGGVPTATCVTADEGRLCMSSPNTVTNLYATLSKLFFVAMDPLSQDGLYSTPGDAVEIGGPGDAGVFRPF
jgi:hypothetical protein